MILATSSAYILEVLYKENSIKQTCMEPEIFAFITAICCNIELYVVKLKWKNILIGAENNQYYGALVYFLNKIKNSIFWSMTFQRLLGRRYFFGE